VPQFGLAVHEAIVFDMVLFGDHRCSESVVEIKTQDLFNDICRGDLDKRADGLVRALHSIELDPR